MNIDVDWSGYLNNQEMAAQELGQMLHAGELALFLGAGISMDHGAPSWHALARAMAWESKVGSAGINRAKIRGGELATIFSKIQRARPDQFEALVKKWLYCRWTPKRGNWASSNLVAMGSLMSGTNRGRIDTVLTLNFDSILEMYLRLYGFIPQSITSFPSTLRRADVHIFHSHGYLPFNADDGSDSSDILLSNQTYLEAMGEDNHPRKRMMEYVFGQKRVLAIGLSGDDIYSRAVLAALAKRNPHGPLMGFWVIGPRDSADKVAALKESKLAAVRMKSYKELPEFLFAIARHAASAMGLK